MNVCGCWRKDFGLRKSVDIISSVTELSLERETVLIPTHGTRVPPVNSQVKLSVTFSFHLYCYI